MPNRQAVGVERAILSGEDGPMSEQDCSWCGLSLNVYSSCVSCCRQLRNAGGVDIPGQCRRGVARPVAASDPDLADLYACGRSRRNEGRNARTAARHRVQRAACAAGAGRRRAYRTGRNVATRAVGQGRGAVRYPRPHTDSVAATP